ncbi:DNA helicase RecQ [Lacihabitans sp. LS3-19]|uniref:DNA helicase RecQ n=1 Tax=Lacihabitans sp. LS3-19 TaxID=2487335 RepID=UPI0020CEBC69|nr:DNA helicase RecQ [Lacihabitans sp. LS3-19]MCP9769450.1 DNA helicase RecQ [Lacihabitans sp. LS3-19]
MDKTTALKKYFGYDSFRPLQAEIIDQILDKKDALVLMPTGGGKSICFQVPAMVMDGLTVVISPLIALMKDQVESLRANGIKASFLNSSISNDEQDAVFWAAKMGELKLLYIAPEKLFSGNMVENFKNLNITLFAIDESHCISSWGHDFRPEYRQLAIIKNEFPDVPVVALTATADKVTRRDICKQLQIPEENTYISSFDRPNISLEVLPGRKRLQQIQSFLNKVPNQSGIIYCLSRRSTETVAESLNKMGFKAEAYHAGISSEKRSRIQENFINDDTPIIVATIAFGMGIDKSNVRWIIHYNMPSNVESFYQEIGRAGRDGTPAQTTLFYSFADIITRTDMIKSSELPQEQKELMLAKLDRMKQYAEANICRRRILISYFNEDIGKDCGNCDVCKNPRKKFEATVIAQKALSAISRTQEKIALTMLVDILRGSRNQSVIRHGYDQLPTFGVGKDLKSEVWVDYILQLLNYGAFDIAYDEGHTFKLNEVSRQILKGQRKVEISEYISPSERQAAEEELLKRAPSKTEQVKGELFEKLRVLRKQIADAIGSPAYIVFSDATLVDMASKKPITKSQFLEVSGVGQEKFKRFGEAFMKEIFEFVNQNKEIASRMGKGLTQAVTFQMYQDGFSVEEIAQQRSIAQSTVISHLIKMKEDGNEIDLTKLIDSWDLNAIGDAAKELKVKKGDALKPLFEHFEGNVGYEKIRLALWLLDLA